MQRIIIDKKKYVIIPEREYLAMQKKAALKTKPKKTFSIDEARAHTHNLISKFKKEMID